MSLIVSFVSLLSSHGRKELYLVSISDPFTFHQRRSEDGFVASKEFRNDSFLAMWVLDVLLNKLGDRMGLISWEKWSSTPQPTYQHSWGLSYAGAVHICVCGDLFEERSERHFVVGTYEEMSWAQNIDVKRFVVNGNDLKVRIPDQCWLMAPHLTGIYTVFKMVIYLSGRDCLISPEDFRCAVVNGFDGHYMLDDMPGQNFGVFQWIIGGSHSMHDNLPLQGFDSRPSRVRRNFVQQLNGLAHTSGGVIMGVDCLRALCSPHSTPGDAGSVRSGALVRRWLLAIKNRGCLPVMVTGGNFSPVRISWVKDAIGLEKCFGVTEQKHTLMMLSFVLRRGGYHIVGASVIQAGVTGFGVLQAIEVCSLAWLGLLTKCKVFDASSRWVTLAPLWDMNIMKAHLVFVLLPYGLDMMQMRFRKPEYIMVDVIDSKYDGCKGRLSVLWNVIVTVDEGSAQVTMNFGGPSPVRDIHRAMVTYNGLMQSVADYLIVPIEKPMQKLMCLALVTTLLLVLLDGFSAFYTDCRLLAISMCWFVSNLEDMYGDRLQEGVHITAGGMQDEKHTSVASFYVT